MKPRIGTWTIKAINTFSSINGTAAYQPVYECSACGMVTESYLRFDKPVMPEDADFPNYCPNCGAKMTEHGTCTEDDMKSPKLQAFEKGLRDMFSSMWDCKIEQEVFEDTVGDLMKAIVQLAEHIFSRDDTNTLRKAIVDKVHDAEKRRFEAKKEMDVSTAVWCGGEIHGYMSIIRFLDELVDMEIQDDARSI